MKKILKRSCLAVNIKSWKESVSTETDGPIGISELGRNWNIVDSQANYFIFG